MDVLTPEMLLVVAQAGESYVRYLYFQMIFEAVCIYLLLGIIAGAVYFIYKHSK